MVHVISTRKVVVIGWDVDVVLGANASIQAKGEEKRDVPNHGHADIFFPADFVGQREITVVGSKSGSETGTINVT